MINQCLNKKAYKERYQTLQEKYTASEEALDHAIYSWANANEEQVNKDGIDINSQSLEDYLDRYFKVKSENIFTNKKDYEDAIKIFSKITKTVWNSAEKAAVRYKKYVELFGAENAVMYKTPDGKTVVRLAKPVFNKEEVKAKPTNEMKNPFNISNVEDSKRKEYAANTGISIDHIESPSEQDLSSYSFTEVTIVTTAGNRIHISPKSGFQDLSGEVKTKEIKAMLGLNYLLEQYLRSNPSEVSKFGKSLLSESAKELYGENYDVSKDNFTSDYAKYIENTSEQKLSRIEDRVEKAVEKLNKARETFNSRIKFDKTTHTYIVYDSAEDKKNDTNGHKAISVTHYLYGKKDIGSWGIPSSAIGNTNDIIIRDFFTNNLKKSYPNMNSKQLKIFIEDLEQLENYIKKTHGENSIIITEEFPIAGEYTVMVKGRPEVRYIAGTMDMIVIDENGKYWGYDMKAKRKGVNESDRENYGNQLGLYDSIFSPYGIEFEGTRLIHSTVMYDGPIDAEYGAGNAVYTVDNNGQLYDNGKKIQSVKGYQAPRLSFINGDIVEGSGQYDTIIPVELDRNNSKMAIEIEALSKEDKELAEEEFGTPEMISKGSSITYGNNKKSAKSDLYNPLLSASERTFLANQAVQQLSYIVTHLQTSKEANNGKGGYFSDGKFAGVDFTTMSREDIIKTVGVETLFKVVKDNIFLKALLNAQNRNVQDKLEIAYKYFEDLINEGYSKLITLEGVTVVHTAESEGIIEDMGDDNTVEDNDTGSLEEKEREYWQLGQRQISAKSSLSKEIRRMFERLKVFDENGNTVKDNFGFGLDTFIDANTAINNILDWCQNCTTIEEMEDILTKKAEYNPYLNTILEKIKDEPIRSLFFKNFRKDFTIYSIVRTEIDGYGNLTYSVHIINTKGATNTIMENLTTAFQTGSMQKLIITKDEVEGKGKVNTKNVEAIINKKDEIVSRIHKAKSKEALKRTIKKEAGNITSLLNDLGIQITSKTVLATIDEDIKSSNITSLKAVQVLDKIGFITDTLLKHKNDKDYNPMLKEQKEGNTFSDYKSLVSIFEKNIEDSIEASTYENGKMYYSFVTPSYMGKLITNLSNAIEDNTKFEKFLEDNYKQYRWFYDSGKWNNTWLDQIENTKFGQKLQHKVQLNFGKTPYNELSELSYTLSLMQEYFYDKTGKLAWYRLPILANKPSSEFVRFVRYSGKDYKRNIKIGLKKVFNQEIIRMKTVLERAVLSSDSGVNKINSFDIDLKTLEKVIGTEKSKALALRIKRKKITMDDIVSIMDAMETKGKHSGAEFRFLEMLNIELREKTKLGQMIVDKLNGKSVNESALDEELIGSDRGNKEGTIDRYMKEIVSREIEQWESIGLFDSEVIKTTDKNGKVTSSEEHFKYLKQLGESRDEIESKLTEYIWNDMFATINLIQLTVTDLAYYKNMEDFQKRYAQVHSPAMRFNTSAIYKGVKVSDGNSRTIYIKDYNVESEIIPNVKEIFDRKIASLKNPAEKKAMKQMADLILSSFKEDLNVTDAQGYSSPTSYRKKMIMAGTWDENMEKAYENISNGKFDVNDLGVVWQPLKPFVYSQIKKTTGVDTMSEIKVPVQNKNSEYMLLIADALMRGGGRKSTLGAIFDFMENSHYDGRKVDNNGKVINKGTYRPDGIDTVQFESAVKSGLMGIIDINNKSYDKVVSTLESAVYYNKDKEGSTDNEMDRFNDQFVHTIPFEDYGIQQEVPAHLVDHQQAMGSQIRILSISDISEYATFKVYNQKGTWDRNYLIDRYQELIANNIRESFNELSKDLNLKDKNDKVITDRKLRNKALSELLIDAIEKDQRYGADLRRACSLDKNDEFIIPPNDPIQSQRIQQLINSIIKSRINKQKVQGGPVVQASVFGTSEDLHIVFNDKEGNPLRAKGKNETDEEYKKYISDNQGSLAYMEVYMPIPSKELEKLLTDEKGNIMDIDEAVTKGIIPKEMLKAIGYRIPTEDKYSMIPMMIKGFLPKAAGEALMMPKEITLLTGSDFDIDKIYVMLKEFKHKVNINKFTKAVLNSYAKKKHKTEVIRDTDAIKTWISELNSKGKIMTKYNGQHYATLQRQIESIWSKRSNDYKGFIEATVGNLGKEDSSTRNNEIFDIQWAVLTNEDTMSKMFNPGSFDVQKKSARIIKALKAGVNKSYSELSAMTKEELDSLAKSKTGNIIFSTTQVAFHKQNMTAGKLIGIFANNNTSHAFLSMQRIHLNLSPEELFTIDGHTVSNSENNLLDRQTALDGYTLISKNIAGFLAASVDAVKDPVLNFMNLNTFTAGPAMVLARLGFDSDSIGLLLTQPIIEKVTREYFKQNNNGYVSVEDVIKQELDNTYGENLWQRMEQNVSATNFSKKMLAEGISKGIDYSENQAMALLLFKRLSGIAKNVNTLTFLTKFNSITNAAGPTIADTLVMEERFNNFKKLMESEKAPFSNNALSVIDNSPILKAFYETTVSDLGASKLIFEPYFPQYSPKFKGLLSIMRDTTKAQLDSKTINKLINDFIFYKLTSGDNPIINSSYEQRNRFINKFVKEFKTRAEGIVDNELINIISSEPSNKRCPVPVLNARTGRFSVDMQERIKTAWSALMENPDTFELGRDLFIYNLYRNGFTFSPKTFLHLASVDTKLAMGEYIDTIADPKFNDNNVNLKEFLLMFRRNHAGESKIVPTLELRKNNGNTKLTATTENGKTVLTISFNSNKQNLESIIANKKKLSTVFAPVIEYNGKLYYTENYEIEGSSGSISYTETTPLGSTNNFLEYNANESASEMKSAIGKKTKNTISKDTSDYEGSSRSDSSVNHDKTDYTLSREDINTLFSEEASLAEYKDEIIDILKNEGEEAATDRTLELMEKFVTETKKKKAKENVKEILKKFCRKKK